MAGKNAPDGDPEAGLEALSRRYGLAEEAREQLDLLLDLLVTDASAPISIRSRRAALDGHLADSLVGLEFDALLGARAVLDLGAGAGLPGLPLAIAQPGTAFTLLESSSRKVSFLEHAIDVCRIPNAEVAHSRAEEFGPGRGRYDVVTARAVAPLPVVLEYAAPLLRPRGTLLVWRGRREPEVEAAAARAAAELGLGEVTVRSVHPYVGVEHRHLYAFPKLAETPSRFPRRPGVALKRPLGSG